MTESKMTVDQLALLKELSLNECVTSDGPDIDALRDLDYVYLWDMYPDGRRRWAITSEGRTALRGGGEQRGPKDAD